LPVNLPEWRINGCFGPLAFMITDDNLRFPWGNRP